MNFDDVLRPVLGVPEARPSLSSTRRGRRSPASVTASSRDVRAYHSVWTTELGRAAAAGGLGDVTEVDFDFEAGRVLATPIKDGYFVLVLFGRGGIPSVARPLLAA